MRHVLCHLIVLMSSHSCSIHHLLADGVIADPWLIHLLGLVEVVLFKALVILIHSIATLHVQWRLWWITIT